MLEFQELQDRIKKEQENFLDTRIDSFHLSSSAGEGGRSSGLLPSLESSFGSTIKLEPFEFLNQDQGLVAPEQMRLSQDHPILKQFLQDTSFQTRFNLKPYDFGMAEGFVIDSGGSQPRSPAPADGSADVPCQDVKPRQETGPSQDDGPRERRDSSSVCGGLEQELEEVKPVLDLAVHQVRKDIETTCEILGIPKGKNLKRVR